MQDLQEAVATLLTLNIYAEYRDEKIKEIFGGKEVSDISGIRVYKNGFNISLEKDVWVVRLPGEGQIINEYKERALEGALKKVEEFYC